MLLYLANKMYCDQSILDIIGNYTGVIDKNGKIIVVSKLETNLNKQPFHNKLPHAVHNWDWIYVFVLQGYSAS